MSDREEVLDAAKRRAAALVRGDKDAVRDLLHPAFKWTSHRGDTFDRASYVERNCSGPVRWQSQSLVEPEVAVVGDTAVVTCRVVDEVDVGSGVTTFSMPLTQTWVREDGRWRLLAGHAGPLG